MVVVVILTMIVVVVVLCCVAVLRAAPATGAAVARLLVAALRAPLPGAARRDGFSRGKIWYGFYTKHDDLTHRHDDHPQRKTFVIYVDEIWDTQIFLHVHNMQTAAGDARFP